MISILFCDLYQLKTAVWCGKGRVQSVTDAPVEEVVHLAERSDVIEEVGGRLKHPVHVSLLGSPGLRPVSAEVDGSLMEEDRVKVRLRGQHVPVLGQMELVRPKLPEIFLVSVRIAPAEDVHGSVHIIV